MDMSRCVACYNQWIAGQEAGLGQLTAALENGAASRASDDELHAVVERCMRAYEEYAASRRALGREDGPPFFAPPWCTSFEHSVLWIGGCRPSLGIRLLYSLSGEGFEELIDEFLRGRRPTGADGLLGITAQQLELVNDLHRRTLREEEALSTRLATLQEDIADRPLLPIVRDRGRAASAAASGGGSSSHGNGCVERLPIPAGGDAEVDAALQRYAAGLARLLEEADQLRLATTRTLATEILKPRQAVELLVAAKQLHLSVRDWSRRREAQQNARPRTVNSPDP